MPLTPGTRLGPYEITAPLGAGGMGEVFRATDTRLGREVAVKVLPQHLSANPEVRARFEREARTVSSLNHPNVCTLFDVGREADTDYLVMELIEGETLAQRLAKGALPGPEVLRLGGQIADALDRAHRAGVIHRDLKPGNVMLTRSGAKLMDFGLARATGMAGPAAGSGVTVAALTHSPTVAAPLTAEGTIVGTFQYMAPEQLEGKEADERSDLWALGCVLYEMATGKRAFEGKSQASLITSIMGSQPVPLSQLAPLSPPGLERLVQACLAKDPADRLQSAHDIRMQLAWLAEGGSQASVAAPVVARRWSRERLVWGLACAGLLAAVLWPAPAPPVARFPLLLRESQALSERRGLALTPDGRTLVYVGHDGPTQRLFVRAFDREEATPLAGTENATNPAISPDGTRIAFVNTSSPRTLRIVPIAGGPVLTLTDSLVDLGGVSWGADGYIYYDGHLEGDGIARIRETGGRPEVASVTDSSRNELYHVNPEALPNGRGLLMRVRSSDAAGPRDDIAVLDTRTGRHRILTAGLLARYTESGHVLYVTSEGMLMAAPFNAGALRATGEAVLVGNGVAVWGNGHTSLVTARDGTMAYIAGSAQSDTRELVWVERDGSVSVADSAWTGGFLGRPTISPDGRAAAVVMRGASGSQIWVKQLDRGPATRVADLGGSPSWSPDGTSLVFSAQGGGRRQSVPADGSALPTSLPGVGGSFQFSSDGQWLVFTWRGDIYGMRTDGDTTRRTLVADPGTQGVPALSPDGRWLAYASDESGTFQVYVRPFPDTKVAKRQVSVGSGWVPRWSRSGREIFYLGADAAGGTTTMMWAADVADGAAFAVETPRALFPATPFSPLTSNYFDVSPDGRRFLFTRHTEESRGMAQNDRIVIVQNFFTELKSKVRR